MTRPFLIAGSEYAGLYLHALDNDQHITLTKTSMAEFFDSYIRSAHATNDSIYLMHSSDGMVTRYTLEGDVVWTSQVTSGITRGIVRAKEVGSNVVFLGSSWVTVATKADGTHVSEFLFNTFRQDFAPNGEILVSDFDRFARYTATGTPVSQNTTDTYLFDMEPQGNDIWYSGNTGNLYRIDPVTLTSMWGAGGVNISTEVPAGTFNWNDMITCVKGNVVSVAYTDASDFLSVLEIDYTTGAVIGTYTTTQKAVGGNIISVAPGYGTDKVYVSGAISNVDEPPGKEAVWRINSDNTVDLLFYDDSSRYMQTIELPTFEYTGVVTNNGSPAAMTVQLFKEPEMRLIDETVSSGVDGTYTLRALVDGEHTIVARYTDNTKGDLIASHVLPDAP